MDTNTSRIPTAEQCLALLKKEGCLPEVITHCIIVRDLAVKIAEYIPEAKRDLVEAGALLHDIGRSQTHGIQHAIIGSKIAKKHHLPDEIVLIIERHIGAGIGKDEAEQLGLPNKDYIPGTLEEKIVAHADNLIDKGKKKKLKRELIKAKRKKKYAYMLRLQQLHSELSARCGIDIDDIELSSVRR